MPKGKERYILSAWGVSDVGVMRDHNEDYFIIADDLLLYAVADGMGGHAGGATASRMAIDILHREVRKVRRPKDSLPPIPGQPEPKADNPSGPAEEDRVRAALLRGFASSNKEIYIKGLSEQSLAGMGTTLSAMSIVGDTAIFGHVGDSRIYLLREDNFVQLSEDHSLVYEHVKAGLITPEQAKQSYFRNIITRSIGTEPSIVVDSFNIKIQRDDIFLLCSDGLITMVEDEEIHEIITSAHLSDAPERLIDAANERGGEDNITALIVRVGKDATTKVLGKKRGPKKKKKGVSRRDIT